MSTFRIAEVLEGPRAFDTKYGPMVAYKVQLDGDQGRGPVELKQKPTSNPPLVGDTLEGEIEQTQYGPRFKKAKPAFAPGNGGPRARDPKETAAIVRQHSQEMALRWIAILQSRGKIPEDAGLEWLVAQINWFQKDAETAEPRV